MLTPKTGLGAGILHKKLSSSSPAWPWRFAAVTWGDAVEGPADGEPTGPSTKPVAQPVKCARQRLSILLTYAMQLAIG